MNTFDPTEKYYREFPYIERSLYDTDRLEAKDKAVNDAKMFVPSRYTYRVIFKSVPPNRKSQSDPLGMKGYISWTYVPVKADESTPTPTQTHLCDCETFRPSKITDPDLGTQCPQEEA